MYLCPGNMHVIFPLSNPTVLAISYPFPAPLSSIYSIPGIEQEQSPKVKGEGARAVSLRPVRIALKPKACCLHQ